MDKAATTPQVLAHLILPAAGGLAPFDGEAAAAAAAGLRAAAERTGSVVLAFAVLPAQVEALLACGEGVAVDALAAEVRRSVTLRVNRRLGRKGALLEAEIPALGLHGNADWVALAEAVEQRVVAAGRAAEPGDTPCSSAHADHAEWVRQVAAPAARPRAPKAAAPAEAAVRIGDLIEVNPVPPVVQLAQVAPLAAALREARPREGARRQLELWLKHWYLADRRTLAVARAVLSSLARPQPGAGCFVTGLYGAGKSHLLAAVSLAAEHALAREVLFEAHADLRDLRPGMEVAGDRLVVRVALDEHGPSQALEDVVFTAAGTALAELGVDAPLAEPDWVVQTVRQHLLAAHRAALDAEAGGSWPALAEADADRAAAAAAAVVERLELPFALAQSRTERLGRLLELAAQAGRPGVVLVLDELSVFLAARERRGLHADAAFLQFLGQRAALQPVWVVAALQKQIEDVGDVEHYTLRQIKDRYETRLTLPLAAARQVLAGKVFQRRDPAALDSAIEATVRAWTGGARLTDLSAGRLRDVYPLHPLTFACLEACAQRLLALTRSVIEFAVARVQGDELAPGALERAVPALVTPDELWDHFARDLAQHPEVRRHRERVADWYERNLAAVLETDDPLAMRLVKLLLVLALAGLQRNVRDLAAALVPAFEGREERVGALLEAMRRRGTGLVVDRHGGAGRDVYRIDVDCDVNETIRRRARSLEATLTEGDGRLTATAAEACRDEAFPLATVLHARSAPVTWCNTRRTVFVALRDLATVSARELQNQAALLANRETEECAYLYLAEPQRVARQREAFAAALGEASDGRWSQALVAWLPREAEPEERRRWVEDVALELVREDPTLAADGAGAALRDRLDEDADARRGRLAALLRRLYAEGEALAAAGSRPFAGGDWEQALDALAAVALDAVFPAFPAIAPRRQVPPRGVANDLIRDLMVAGEVTCSPTSVLAAAVEDVAMPLGVATGEDGQYAVSVRTAGVVADLLDRLPDRPVALAAVEGWLAKSAHGLPPELSQVLVAALVRAGYLAGVDDAGAPAALAAPLRAAVAAVRPALLVPAEVWERLERASRLLLGRDHPPLGAAAQQGLFERLVRWREAALAGTQRVRQTAERVRQALGHEPLQWRDVDAVCERIETLARSLDPAALPADALTGLAEALDAAGEQALARLVRAARRLAAFAETQAEPLLALARDLAGAHLPAAHALSAPREALLARLAAGESVAFEAEALLAEAAGWRRAYDQAYAAWHAEVHAAERFAPYDAFRTAPLMRSLSNLSRLNVDVPDSADAVAEALRRERTRQCRRAELALLAAEHLVCPDCGVRLGEPLPLHGIERFEAEAAAGVRQVLAALRAPEAEARIRRGLADLEPDDPRRTAAERLLAEPEPTPEELLAATPFSVIDLLNTLLTARVVARRSVAALTPRLAGKRLTAPQVRQAVDRWIDPEGRLDDEGLIEIEE